MIGVIELSCTILCYICWHDRTVQWEEEEVGREDENGGKGGAHEDDIDKREGEEEWSGIWNEGEE